MFEYVNQSMFDYVNQILPTHLPLVDQTARASPTHSQGNNAQLFYSIEKDTAWLVNVKMT